MQDTQPYHRARSPQARPIRPMRQAPRRRANWGRRLKLTAFALLIAALAATVLVWMRASAFNDAVSEESALSMRLFGPLAGGDRVNVLLLGYSDDSRDGGYLSDSMNLISIDRATDITSIIPIPRDIWVEGLPEVPQNMKINEAFRIGYYGAGFPLGGELASKAVTRVTGLPIDGWISIDFQGFQAMVDAVGGITVENPRAFSYTWTDDDWAAGIFHASFAAGTLELDGEQALDYARTRYADVPEEHGDFARLERQQRVMHAIRDKVAGWQAVPRGLAALDALEGHLHTNVPVLDLGMLFGKLEADHRIELDALLQATTNTIGQFIFVVAGAPSSSDYSPLHAYIEEQLSNPPPPASPAPSAPE